MGFDTAYRFRLLCFFSFIQREGKGSNSDAACTTPPRLMTARRLMADHVARLAAEQLQEGKATPHDQQIHVTNLIA